MRLSPILILFSSLFLFPCLGNSQIKGLSLKGTARLYGGIDGMLWRNSQGISPIRAQSWNGLGTVDLTTDYHPQNLFHIRSDIRLMGGLGDPYRSNSRVYVRQLRMGGEHTNSDKRYRLSYNIGDYDTKMTPFVLHSQYPGFRDYESPLFRYRKSLGNYEAFHNKNNWRLPGIYFMTERWSRDYFHKYGIEVFAAKPKEQREWKVPELYLLGAKVWFNNSHFYQLGINFLRTSEWKKQNQANTVNNLSANITLHPKDKPTQWGFKGELTLSQASQPSINLKQEDLATEAGFYGVWKWGNTKGTLSYRYVGKEFLAPGAQSLRIDDTSSPTLFSQSPNGSGRLPSLLDRMNLLGIYRPDIQLEPQAYNPAYSWTEPYGKATPNRHGVNLQLSELRPSSFFAANGDIGWFQEITATSGPSRRNFLRVQAGSRFQFSYSSKHKYRLGAKYERSYYKASDKGLNLLSWDAGYSWNPHQRWRCELGAHGNLSSGTDSYFTPGIWNPSSTVIELGKAGQDIDLNEVLLGAGIKYTSRSFGYFYLQYFLNMYQNRERLGQNNFQDQIVLVYKYRF